MFYSLRLALFLLIFPWGIGEAAQFLSTNEVKALISGHSSTFYGTYGLMKFTGETWWGTNGTVHGYTLIGGKKRNWSGTWYLKDNLYCRRLNASGRTDFKCLNVQQINANQIRFLKLDGSVSSTSYLR